MISSSSTIYTRFTYFVSNESSLNTNWLMAQLTHDMSNSWTWCMIRSSSSWSKEFGTSWSKTKIFWRETSKSGSTTASMELTPASWLRETIWTCLTFQVPMMMRVIVMLGSGVKIPTTHRSMPLPSRHYWPSIRPITWSWRPILLREAYWQLFELTNSLIYWHSHQRMWAQRL